MRAVIQRVSEADVSIEGEVVGSIGRGLVILLGVGINDGHEDVGYLAGKIPLLRIFNDSAQKMNLSLVDVGGAILAVSQFTLYASTRKGRRPGYTHSAPPERAEPLYLDFIRALRSQNIVVAEGIFGAMMSVRIVNDGPVTIIMDSNER